MRSILVCSTVFVAALITMAGCSATKKTMTNMGMTTPQLTKDLSKQLGITEDQATNGVGAILQGAAEKLNATEFDSLSKAVPGIDGYMKAAQNALGGAKLTDLGGVKGAFKKIGLKPEMVDQFKPVVLDYVGRYSPSARTMLADVL